MRRRVRTSRLRTDRRWPRLALIRGKGRVVNIGSVGGKIGLESLGNGDLAEDQTQLITAVAAAQAMHAAMDFDPPLPNATSSTLPAPLAVADLIDGRYSMRNGHHQLPRPDGMSRLVPRRVK